jgi:hypothetical protein
VRRSSCLQRRRIRPSRDGSLLSAGSGWWTRGGPCGRAAVLDERAHGRLEHGADSFAGAFDAGFNALRRVGDQLHAGGPRGERDAARQGLIGRSARLAIDQHPPRPVDPSGDDVLVADRSAKATRCRSCQTGSTPCAVGPPGMCASATCTSRHSTSRTTSSPSTARPQTASRRAATSFRTEGRPLGRLGGTCVGMAAGRRTRRSSPTRSTCWPRARLGRGGGSAIPPPLGC